MAVRPCWRDHAAGASDLVLRNVTTGAFEVYNIANNQITGASLSARGRGRVQNAARRAAMLVGDRLLTTADVLMISHARRRHLLK